MIKWQDIPDMYKAGAALVALTVFVLTYHNQFVTTAEAMEMKQQQQEQLILLRVDNKEAEKRALIRAKAKAVAAEKRAEAEQLEQDIQTLRDQIKGLCEEVKDC
jgi:replication fork clamp-binding protein CrfC